MPEEKRIINSNEYVAKKVESFLEEKKKEKASGFKAGLNAPELEVVDGPDEEQDAAEQIPAAPVYEGPSPEELLAQAQERIDQMETEANARLEAERKGVLEEARNTGYQDGFASGVKDGLAQTEAMKKELLAEQQQIKEEYRQMTEELEPRFVECLTGIYEHIFKVELDSYKDIVLNLISSAMSRIEGAKNYLVHVSKEDFPYVSMQKRVIQEACILNNAVMEISEDLALKKGECLIETEGGIYDCGLDTQLSELSRKLKLLSYERAED